MATLMQKDVLIEMTAYANALINNKRDGKDTRKDKVLDMRDYLYNTNHNEINAEEVVAFIKPIIDELEELPNHPRIAALSKG